MTLTATADTGWTFTGWSGDINGMQNPLELVVEDDMTIIATFNATIYLPLVLKNR